MSAFARAMTRERIAKKVTTKQQERERIKAEFMEARKQYTDACGHLVATYDRRAALVAEIQQNKDNMEGFVQGWLASGQITGTNAEARKASLALFKEQDAGYTKCATLVQQDERILKIEVEPEIIREEQRIRLARYEMEMAISEGRMIAGEEDERHTR